MPFRIILPLLFLQLLAPQYAYGQQILIDESFSDWQDVETLYEDATGDNAGIDFSALKMTNDDQFLYVYFEMGEELNLQNDNNITLYIDTDHDSETGVSGFGIGYEFEFTFGNRGGTFHGNQSSSFGAYDVGLITSPTVTSSIFELKIDLDAEIDGEAVFNSQSINIVLKSDGDSGDSMPENGETITYEFGQDIFEAPAFRLSKYHPSDIRVLSYNVLRDNLFDPSVEDNFRRIFQAIKPDVIGLSEVYDNSGEQAAALIETFLPSEQGEQWYSGDTGNDNLIVSRYPIIEQESIDGNAAFLLDLGEREMFTIVAHPPCCSNDSGRQNEFDAMMGFLRDSQNGSEFDISTNTPIVIMGDMNLVGLSRQQTTLLTGDIDNEQAYGNDFNPDWDGSSLEDAKPLNPGSPTTFTWYDQGSSFGAGRLDYIVYSGSVLELTNSYSLFTPSLDGDSLAAYGLDADDTILASDHLPLVTDFRLPSLTSNEVESDSPKNIALYQNHPNPFNPSTLLSYSVNEPATLTLTVHSITGKRIATLIKDEFHRSGTFSVNFDSRQLLGLATGVYIYRLATNTEIITKKMVLAK